MARIDSLAFTSLFAALLLVTAGCTTYSTPGAPESETPNQTLTTAETTTVETTPEGDIRVYEVEDVPRGVTVMNATDERVRDVDPLQDALDRALDSETNSSSIHVTGRRFAETDEALDELDGYMGTDAPAGYYIRKDGTVFVVFIAVYE